MGNENNKIVNGEKEKNILILCMSTLGGFKINYYSNDIICQNLKKNIKKAGEMNATKLQADLEDELKKEPGKEPGKKPCVFRGISQLEPGTKYIMAKLCKQGRYLNKIYIIASDDARKKDKKIIDRKINVGGNFLKTKDGEETYISNLFTEEFEGRIENEFSAVDFYKLRIEQFIKGKETKGLNEDIENNENNGIYFDDNLSNYFSEGIITEGFFEVKALKGNIFDVISDLCKNIREDSNDNVNLFVDMQGGSRIDLSNLNVAIKMLEMDSDKLKLEQAVAVGFNPDGKRSISPMVDATINFWMLDMEAGMKEFIKTGRGDTLREFWEKLPVRYRREEDIINSIVAISDSIQWCDPKGFDDGLDNLKDALNSYYKTDEKGPLFSTFVEDLKKDYVNNGLLDDNNNVLSKPEHNTINQIKWCMSKDLYQQALTLLEARMPNDIACKMPINVTRYVDYFITSMGIKKMNMPGYLFDNKQKNKISDGHKNNVFIKYILKISMDLHAFDVWADDKIRNKTKEEYEVIKKDISIEIDKQIKNINFEKIIDNIISKVDTSNKIKKMIALYNTLSGIRNYSDHADSNNKKFVTKVLVQNFVDVYEEVINFKYGDNIDSNLISIVEQDIIYQETKNAVNQMKQVCCNVTNIVSLTDSDNNESIECTRYKYFRNEHKKGKYIALFDILEFLHIKEGHGMDFNQYCKYCEKSFKDSGGDTAKDRLKIKLQNI